MNPELALGLMNQHTRQLRADAQRERAGRKLRELRRARRRAVTSEIAPVIPDTVAGLVGETADVPAQRRGAATTTR
jgi:hypothetical protein